MVEEFHLLPFTFGCCMRKGDPDQLLAPPRRAPARRAGRRPTRRPDPAEFDEAVGEGGRDEDGEVGADCAPVGLRLVDPGRLPVAGVLDFPDDRATHTAGCGRAPRARGRRRAPPSPRAGSHPAETGGRARPRCRSPTPRPGALRALLASALSSAWPARSLRRASFSWRDCSANISLSGISAPQPGQVIMLAFMADYLLPAALTRRVRKLAPAIVTASGGRSSPKSAPTESPSPPFRGFRGEREGSVHRDGRVR
jgi:hypothetical protein